MTKFLRTVGGTLLAALVLSASVTAATVVGTARNDTLRGTARADVLSGKAGNDRLYGLGGNDVLIGGPGSDVLSCGAGRDTANAGPGDRIGADCETVRGLPALSVGDASVGEGDAGQATLSFVVTRSPAARHASAVRYSTSDGTATSPADYAASSGTLRFAAGEATKTIEIAVTGDIEVEQDETFTVALAAPSDATLADRVATGTIQNEDRPRPRAGTYTGTTSQGRSVRFDVSPELSRLTGLSVSLDFSCTNGQSFANESFTFSSAIPIAQGTWAFEFDAPLNEPNVLANFSFAGALAAPGSASGRVRFDLVVNTPGGAVACSTGDVSWTAG